MTVRITKINLNVAEGKLAGTQLETGSVTVTETVLNQVQQEMPQDQMGYDKVDVDVILRNGDNEKLDIGIRYDIKVNTQINLRKRLQDSLKYFAESPFSTDEEKANAQEWLSKEWK